MRKPVSLALVILAGLSAGAFAATNMTITQKGRVFSSESVTLKKGEALVICAIHPRMKMTVKITD